jgi:heme/copper-type cytochrome/quinol oxidase subunit 4
LKKKKKTKKKKTKKKKTKKKKKFFNLIIYLSAIPISIMANIQLQSNFDIVKAQLRTDADAPYSPQTDAQTRS